jgi:hypothetical protein
MLEQHCSVKKTIAEGNIELNSSLVMSMLGTLYRKRKKGWQTFESLKDLDHDTIDDDMFSGEVLPEKVDPVINDEDTSLIPPVPETLNDIVVMKDDPIALINDISRILSTRFGFPMIDAQRNPALMIRVLILCQDNLEFVEQMFDIWVGRGTRVASNQALFTLLAVYLSNWRGQMEFRGFLLARARAIVAAMKKGGMYRESSVRQLCERNMRGESGLVMNPPLSDTVK